MKEGMLSPGQALASGADRAQRAPRAGAAGAGVSHAIAGLQAMSASLRGLLAPDRLPAAARLSLITQLEDDARDTIARVLAAPEQLPARGLAGWPRFADEACTVFGALLDTYAALAAQADSPAEIRSAVDLRLAGAAAQRLKWELVSCGPAHLELWRLLGGLWTRVEPSSAAARECLRALAYFTCGLDQLPPAALSAVDRLVSLLLPHLELVRTAGDGGHYVFQPAAGSPPRRMVRGDGLPEGALCFVTGGAFGILSGLAGQLARGVTPGGLGGAGAAGHGLPLALQMMLRQWSDTPPVRRYRRHLLNGRLTAVRGFEDIKALVGGERPIAGGEWLMRDASRGGVGALLPDAAGDHVRTGDLVGLRAPEGEAWHLGVVRRKRATGEGRLIGVETLSQQPELVSADDGRTASEVLLCDPLLKGEAVRILTSPGALMAGAALFISQNGTIQKLKPLDAVGGGADFELRVYQVL